MDGKLNTCIDWIAYIKGIICAMGDKWIVHTGHGACSRHPNFKLECCWDIQMVCFKRIED
jgi:hypothetical protein